MSIQVGNSTQTNNTTKREYKPEAGLLKVKVVGINPTTEEIAGFFGKKDMNWKTDYIGKTAEGDRKVNMDIWLQDVETKQYHHLKFIIADKNRVSKNTGSFQWVNTAGQLVFSADVSKQAGTMYEEFIKREYRVAKVGEENLTNFLTAWCLQGKKATDDQEIYPDLNRIFSGDFSELKALVPVIANKQDQGIMVAMATISTASSNGKTYSNIWKTLAPGWWWEKILVQDKSHYGVKAWLEAIQGPYGPKDKYSLDPLGKEQPTPQPTQTPTYNGYGQNPPSKLPPLPQGSDDLPF